MIAHVAKDLMLSSTASATARSVDRDYRMVGSVEKLRELFQSGEPPQLLFVDLQCPGLDAEGLRDLLAEHFVESGRQAIGYAQHVEEVLLGQAEGLGLQHIMTRGQFNRSLESLVRMPSDG